MATIGNVGATDTSNMQTSQLGLQDFLHVLLTQITYQDPLKPMDNEAFMAQMAQFTQLGQAQQLNTKMDALLSTQAALQSVGLVGKHVTAVTSAGAQVTGQVTALSLNGSVPTVSILQANATDPVTGISLGQIQLITP